MKSIHYDAEGDILSVTFASNSREKHTGIELSDNIVFYYNPSTKEPLGLVLLSYSALLRASTQIPILLDGLERAPRKVQELVIPLLQRHPVTSFVQVLDVHGTKTSHLSPVFTPDVLRAVA